MHQMSIYSGVYTEETLPLKPIVSEVRGGGVSEESDGCLGDCVAGFARSDYSSGNAGSHWATVFLPRGRGKKIVVIHSVNQGLAVAVRARCNPGRMEGADCTSLPAKAQSDRPRDHSAYN